MRLRCKTCGAIQPVAHFDEADEDARNQSIRRAFRAEHVASCGDGSVLFELTPRAGGPIEVDGVLDFAKSIDHPHDVRPTVDGYFTRDIERDGVKQAVRVCEDCWQNIPRYVDFPFGLISPESDGHDGVTGKMRRIAMQTDLPSVGIEHLRKAVCLPCYRKAFRRVYPTAALPDLRDDVIGDGAPVAPPPPPPDDALLAGPKGMAA